MRVILCLVLSLLVSPAFAQSATVAMFPSTATDPNTSMPIAAPVSYTPICNQLPKIVEVPPIINPIIGAYDDPANVSRDCVVQISPQILALATTNGYKAALRLGTAPYGAFSSSFAVAAQPVPHACDSTPSSLITALVGQVLTIGWCHSGLNTAGSATGITGWRFYRNGVAVAQTVTVGTVNATGLRYYSTTRSEPATGAISFQVSALNTAGESALMPALAITITQPATVPVAPSRGRIQ